MSLLNMNSQKILGAFLLFASSMVSAVQPLTEADMDNVSAEIGQNILDIFGPAAAGLEDDIDPSEGSTESADTSNKDAADVALKDEERRTAETGSEQAITFDSFEEAQTAIEQNTQTIGTASAFKTSSEIQYKTKNFSHKADFLGDGSVVHTRDLKIDLLKLENLRGDYNDGDRTVGNIYLSNWESRGSTRMQERD